MATAIPTQIVEQQTGFAPVIAPYAERLLGRAEAMFQDPYQQYQGDRFAQFTPLQQQAFAGAQSMEAAPQLRDASALAGTAGLQALAYGQYRPMQFNTQSFGTPGAASYYMSPYMQNVVDVQQQQAQRQADIANQALKAQAAQAGAFGGGRFAVQQAQAAADLARQKQAIQAQGLQSAYGQGMQQFNTEQQNRLQGAQLGEQSRQYGAGLGLQGLQTAMQGAQQLGNLGQTQFNQNLALNQLQAQYGGLQQQQMQNILGAQYQDFLNFQNYPYKQLSFMSDILRGAPLSQTGSTVYQQPPSTISQLAGLGAIGKGVGLFKKGGQVKAPAKSAGLADLAIYNMGR